MFRKLWSSDVIIDNRLYTTILLLFELFWIRTLVKSGSSKNFSIWKLPQSHVPLCSEDHFGCQIKMCKSVPDESVVGSTWVVAGIMRVTGFVEVSNRVLPSLNMQSRCRGAQSQVAIGRKPGSGPLADPDVWLLISNQQNRSGNSYRVKYVLFSSVCVCVCVHVCPTGVRAPSIHGCEIIIY